MICGNQPVWEPWEPTSFGTNQWEPTSMGTNRYGVCEPISMGTNQYGNQSVWEPISMGTHDLIRNYTLLYSTTTTNLLLLYYLLYSTTIYYSTTIHIHRHTYTPPRALAPSALVDVRVRHNKRLHSMLTQLQ